jgi:ParB family chromosome partitioning protein
MSEAIKPPASKPAPLGRGLSALFGDTDASYQAPPIARISPGSPGAFKPGAHQMALAWLQPGAFQPRRNFSEESLKGLAESIREHGIIEPLLARPVKNAKDMYEIVAGERRWRAAQMAKLHEVPVIIRELSDREALEFAIIENVQREDLSPLEEAEGYQRLLGEFNHSPEALSKIVGKSRPYVSNMLRLLTLPPDVKQLVDEGKLTAGHARALVGSFNPAHFAKEVIERGLNVRQTEALVKERTDNPQNFLKGQMSRDANREALEKELGRITGVKVKIKTRGARGSIALHFKNLDQLDGIVRKLKG